MNKTVRNTYVLYSLSHSSHIVVNIIISTECFMLLSKMKPEPGFHSQYSDHVPMFREIPATDINFFVFKVSRQSFGTTQLPV
jgi:hypothetical protein